MKTQVSVTFSKDPDREELAMVLEIIAGEIRRGRVAGAEPAFSWILDPPSAD